MAKEIKKTEKKMSFAAVKSVVLRPYLSEKSHRLLSDNQYVFLVDPDANKILVKREVERTYGVHVRSITMTTLRVKPRTYRGKTKHFRNKKKATVRIAAGEKIDIA